MSDCRERFKETQEVAGVWKVAATEAMSPIARQWIGIEQGMHYVSHPTPTSQRGYTVIKNGPDYSVMLRFESKKQVRTVKAADPTGIIAKLSEKVSGFVTKHDLSEVVREVLTQLNAAFGKEIEVRQSVFLDPEDGSEQLFFEIPATDTRTADRHLSKFCYDWWFDRIGEVGHLIGFRVIASSEM